MSSREDDLHQLLEQTSDEGKRATDQAPDKSVPDANIDDKDLSEVLMSDLQNDIQDKEEMGWVSERIYDLKTYYQDEDEELKNFPYPNSSAYIPPITKVQLNTAFALIGDLVYRNPNKVVVVNPVGEEDNRKADNVEWLLNWQVLNDIKDFKFEHMRSNFLSLLHGTAYEKVLRVGLPNEISVRTIPIEYIYLPSDSTSPEISHTDHVTELIPLNDNDIRMRLSENQYRNMDKISKSFFPISSTAEQLETVRSQIYALSGNRKMSRNTWWIAETYKTFYPRHSLKPIELIVQWAPGTGAILRVTENKEAMRPYVDKYHYPNYGKAFHMSLPGVIKPIQKKATYKDKQCNDAVEKAISPAIFYDGTERFDPRLNMRAPTSMYPMKNLNSMKQEEVNLAPVLSERAEIRDLYLQAERVLGITDLMQGVGTSTTDRTLGQAILRTKKADIRFTSIKDLVTYHWHRKIEKIYQYDNLYMPRDVKIKVLGSRRYEVLDKLFPRDKTSDVQGGDFGLGLTGRFDFYIANKSIDEQENDNQRRAAFYGAAGADPVFGVDKGNHYRCLEEQAESNEIYDFDTVIKRPMEADSLTPDEVINRLMDGDEVQPDPNVNPGEYARAIEVYMHSGNFKDAPEEIRMKMFQYWQFMDGMRKAQALAFQDFSRVQGLQSHLGNNLLPGNEPGTPPTPIPQNPASVPPQQVPSGAGA